MTRLEEKELEFTFSGDWTARQFDIRGRTFPRGIHPVDFILDRGGRRYLVEVKDPSATGAPEAERRNFVKKMQSNELCDELVPKARTTYGFLHLMDEVGPHPLIYVVVIGAESLSIQPPLLLSLAQRLERRLRQEADEPWRRGYVDRGIVVTTANIASALPGCAV